MNKYIVTTIVAITLIVGFSVIANNGVEATKSPYRSGYDHGASDARDDCSDGCDWYILEPGKGLAFHTEEFNEMASATISPPGRGSDADEATFSCP